MAKNIEFGNITRYDWVEPGEVFGERENGRYVMYNEALGASRVKVLQELRNIINGRGDNLTKVLKCKDVLSRYQ